MLCRINLLKRTGRPICELVLEPIPELLLVPMPELLELPVP